MDEARVSEQLGGLQSDVRAMLRALDELAGRLDRHFDDDLKLAERISRLEIEQARVAGFEAIKDRRSAALASIAGIIAGLGGGWISRALWGGHP